MAEEAQGLSKEERAALKDLAAERRRQSSRKGSDRKAKDRQDVLDAIERLPEGDRAIASRLHEVITDAAPELDPKTWYGFPAYAKGGKVVVFWQPAAKFGTRYGQLGFNDVARLDDGESWPVAFAIVEVTPEVETRVAALVRRAVAE